MVAIVLQGVWAIVIALVGTYAQVVNYVIAMDCIFFGLTAVCLFVLRRREARTGQLPGAGTSLDDIAFHRRSVADCDQHLCPLIRNELIGLGIALAGLPIYFLCGATLAEQARRCLE